MFKWSLTSGMNSEYSIKPLPDKRCNRFVYVMSDTEVPYKEIRTSPSLFFADIWDRYSTKLQPCKRNKIKKINLPYLVSLEKISAQGVKFIWRFHSSQAENTHPKTAVHSWDEHDSRQDNETGDEETDHQTGAAGDTVCHYIHMMILAAFFMVHCLFL